VVDKETLYHACSKVASLGVIVGFYLLQKGGGGRLHFLLVPAICVPVFVQSPVITEPVGLLVITIVGILKVDRPDRLPSADLPSG
jgi:hypothetical protein